MLTVSRHSLELNSGKIGLISDTHGLLRPEALAALRGAELLIHAGDIGNPQVLDSLRQLAPVLAIRGNNDRQPWARQLPDILELCVNGFNLQVIHDVNERVKSSDESRWGAVISGHSHKPGVIERDRVLYINPGSAGPRRFKLPVTVGKMFLGRRGLRTEIISLEIKPQSR